MDLVKCHRMKLFDTNGGDWIGGDLIDSIFECGRKLGQAIGDVIWG